MGHDIGQFDIPNRQLMASSAHSSMWSDIGEAKITRTIFGRHKIRVVREKDRILRTWLLAALAAMALAAAAWEGWTIYQQSREIPAPPPLSERISVSPPVFIPASIAPAASRSAGKGRQESLIQTEIDSLVASPNVRPPRPPNMLPAKPEAANPPEPKPVPASRPQKPGVAANAGPVSPAGVQSHGKLPIPNQKGAPATAASPAASAQPAASKPQLVPPVEPLSKKDPANTQSANDPAAVNARGTPIIFAPPDNEKP